MPAGWTFGRPVAAPEGVSALAPPVALVFARALAVRPQHAVSPQEAMQAVVMAAASASGIVDMGDFEFMVFVAYGVS
ncbi:MAG TPA: hypothetical protein VMG80_05175 [Solirubrobacteraceae bacterium]|nr:hypothetical protein [Solirubrobacteraceae bacterium]